MRVRHLQPGENWPSTLFMGFDGDMLDRDWTWVAEDDQAIQAGLLTCPMHSVLFLLRIAAAAGAPRMAIRTLLNAVLQETREKGFVGYTTLIDTATVEGRRLEKLALRKGSFEWPSAMKMVFGSYAVMEKV